jgi:phospholipid/cholesterol/gamma-HCH transport system substrate-binding protein
VRRSWAPVIVGVFVAAVVALSYFLIRATSERSSGAKGYAVYGLFQDASGLFEKSRVQTAGIAVGQIDNRELDIKTKRAKVTIRVLPHITLYENAAVTKKSASLLGEYFLEIDPGSPLGQVNGELKTMRALKEGDQILKVYEPTPIGTVMADVGTLLPILRDILEDVRKLTGGTITNIAENVNTLIETNSEVLERLLNRVDHIAANVEGITTSESDNVKQSIKNIREITESIKGLIGTTHGQVAETGGAVKGSIERLQSTLSSLDKTMKNVESISNRLEKGEGTAGRLLTDDTIARNVEEITEDAGGFVRSLTRLQTIVGLRSEYNFLSSTFKNYLSIQLMPRPDKFYLIELVEDPRGYRSVTNTVTNNSATGITTEEKVTITDQLRFSLMLGKRVGPVAGRFGIKESTGGAGADLYLFRDRLVLSADLYDARTNQRPRIKGTMQYAVWNRNLFLVAGIDDLANFTRPRAGAGGGIDWFLGGQLTFNDEDLKALLLFGGGFASGAASSK